MFFPNCSENLKEPGCDSYQDLSKIGISADHIKTNTEHPGCGVRSQLAELTLLPRIIERGQWPWLVDIEFHGQYYIQFICGGTLVNQRVVVTAAHCLHNANNDYKLVTPNELELFLGRYNRYDYNEKTFVQYGVADIVIHPDYQTNSGSFDANIGFLITDKIVEYTTYIKPACIWDGSDSISDVLGEEGTVVGWDSDVTENSTGTPYEVHGNIVSEEECIASSGAREQVITRRSFCASHNVGSRPCRDDSSGAFLLKKDNKWMLRGVLSAISSDSRKEICDTAKYAKYTDIAKFKFWLEMKINELFDKN